MGPAVFLDRDGTLIDDPGYLSDPDQVRLLGGHADLGEADLLEDLAHQREGVDLVGEAAQRARQGLLAATGGGDQADADLDEPHVELGVGPRGGAVHGDLAATAQGQPEGRGHDGDGAVAQELVGLLEVVDGLFEGLPVALHGGHDHQHQVGARAEGLGRVVADDHADEVALRVLEGLEDHGDDVRVHGVHLGVQLEAGHAVAQIDQRRAVVLGHDRALRLGHQHGQGPRRLGHTGPGGVLGVAEVEVGPRVGGAGVERRAARRQHVLDPGGGLDARAGHAVHGLGDDGASKRGDTPVAPWNSGRDRGGHLPKLAKEGRRVKTTLGV